MKSYISIDNVKIALASTPYSDFQIEQIEEGVSADVFKLSRQNEVYFLRVLPEDESIEFQLLAHELILKKGVKIPKIVFFQEQTPTLDKKSFMIVTEIHEKSISNSKNLTNNQLSDVLYETGKELALINSIEINGIGWIEEIKANKLVAYSKNYQEFIINENMGRLAELEKEKIISFSIFTKTKNYIETNSNLFDLNENSYLAHGDFGNSHIFQKNGKYSGIIDFGDIRGTTKFHDLAHYSVYHGNELPFLIKGYGSVYKLPIDYVERIKAEALIIAIGKLWWIWKNFPERLLTHPTFKFLLSI